MTVLQRVDLGDRIALSPAPRLTVAGFAERHDRRSRRSRTLAARQASSPPGRVEITKSIPVAAGLGGGSSDAASALRSRTSCSTTPLEGAAARELAATIGADVPFFLATGPQLGEADGSALEPLDLPQDYWVVLVLPDRRREDLDGGRLPRLRRAGMGQSASTRDERSC